jgi:hypothetical protein
LVPPRYSAIIQPETYSTPDWLFAGNLDTFQIAAYYEVLSRIWCRNHSFVCYFAAQKNIIIILINKKLS